MAHDVLKLKSGTKVKTAGGSELTVKIGKRTGLTLSGKNTVKVVKTDIEASNGVIHVLDNVLLPPAPKKMEHHDKM